MSLLGSIFRARDVGGRWPALLSAVGIALALNGCASTQTRIIEHHHWELNASIRETHTEQLLLNIVRLRYDETPFFLQVASISTSFSSSAGVGVTGQLPSSGPNVLGLNGSLSYSETPTVTWSLPDSREFLGRLMAPVGADQLTVLAQAGWDPEQVMRVGVKKMNRLRNLDHRAGQGMYEPDTYGQFREVLRLIGDLSQEGLLDLAYGVKSYVRGAELPVEQLDTRAIPDGLAYGLQFMTRQDPGTVVPLKLTKPLFLRFSKQSDSDARARRVRELLALDPDTYSFGIVDTANSSAELVRSEAGRVAKAFDPDARYDEVVVNNRSVMEMLYFAASYVQVPDTDIEQKRVRAGIQRPAADWLNILSAPAEPSDAWIKAEYRGVWFYIAADDLRSRATFTLLDAIFASVVGSIPGATPLLTLPVK